MSWAKQAIGSLARGQIAKVRPRGYSMKGKVEDGALVTVEPVHPATLAVGILCWSGWEARFIYT